MTTIIVPLIKFFSKKMNGIWNLTRFGKERNLYFSSKDVLAGSVIALDARKRKLLFFRQSDYRQSCMIVDLAYLDSCSVVRQYNGINAGELRKNKLQMYLSGIFLHLRFKNNAKEIAVPFYDSNHNRGDDIERLEIKANKWKLLVSKVLPAK